jgi:hypothetical protein
MDIDHTEGKPTFNPYFENLGLWDHRNHRFEAVPTMHGCLGRLRWLRDDIRHPLLMLPSLASFREGHLAVHACHSMQASQHLLHGIHQLLCAIWCSSHCTIIWHVTIKFSSTTSVATTKFSTLLNLVLVLEYRGDSLADAGILYNYIIQLFSTDTSINNPHDRSMETREDSPGGQWAGFWV